MMPSINNLFGSHDIYSFNLFATARSQFKKEELIIPEYKKKDFDKGEISLNLLYEDETEETQLLSKSEHSFEYYTTPLKKQSQQYTSNYDEIDTEINSYESRFKHTTLKKTTPKAT